MLGRSGSNVHAGAEQPAPARGKKPNAAERMRGKVKASQSCRGEAARARRAAEGEAVDAQAQRVRDARDKLERLLRVDAENVQGVE